MDLVEVESLHILGEGLHRVQPEVGREARKEAWFRVQGLGFRIQGAGFRGLR